MSVEQAHPGGEQLRLLLSEDAESDDSRFAAEHVQHCPACQTRLTELAGDESWWSTARELLADAESDDAGARWEPDASWTPEFPLGFEPFDSDALDPESLDPDSEETLREQQHAVRASIEGLLDSPSHPEMLGRLGRYEVESVIGCGGMGAVLKAHDSELNRPVAIKVLAAHLAHVGAARQRFAREGRAAAAVVHDHVVAVHNVESHGNAPFLVMQYVPGQSLQARVDQQGPLSAAEVLRIGRQAAAGLAAAHAQGLVHRDVKPSNILLENDVERAMLTDFGLARAIDDASLTRTGVIAGTPHYMSPEQACGGPVDLRSDLFGLGAVLYFMCTGRPPFRAANTLAVLNRICHEAHRPVWQVAEGVPDELSDLIDQLLEKKPGRRPASAADVESQLATMLSRHQQRGAPRRRFFLWRNRRNRRRLAWGAAAAALATAIGAAVAWWAMNRHSTNLADGQAASVSETSPAATAEVGESLGALTQAEQRYAAELEATWNLLESAGGQTEFISAGDANWNREIEVIDAAIRNLEMTDEVLPVEQERK